MSLPRITPDDTIPRTSTMSDEIGSFETNARVAPTMRDVASTLHALSKKRSPVSHYAQIALAVVLASCMLFLVVGQFVMPPPRPRDIGAGPYIILALCFLLSPLGRHHVQALIMRLVVPALYAPFTIVRFTMDAMVIEDERRVREIPFTNFVVRATSKRAFMLGNASGAPERVVPQRAFTDTRAREAFAAIVAGKPPTVTVVEAIHTFGGSDDSDDVRFVLNMDETIAAMRIIVGEGWFHFFRTLAFLLPVAVGAYAFMKNGPLQGALTMVFIAGTLAYARLRAKRGNALARSVEVELRDVVTVRSVGGARVWKWTECIGRVEDDLLVVLFFGKYIGLAIPKRVIGAGSLERIRERVHVRT
jgi:hypothetical protein